MKQRLQHIFSPTPKTKQNYMSDIQKTENKQCKMYKLIFFILSIPTSLTQFSNERMQVRKIRKVGTINKPYPSYATQWTQLITNLINLSSHISA